MRKINYYTIGFIAVFSLNACSRQDSATAEGVPPDEAPAASAPAEPAPVARAPAAPAAAPVIPPAAPAPVVCQNCGTVRSVTPITQQGQSTGAGAVIGAIVGGVAGNQVGGGSGRRIATAAGAIGGAFLGNNVEQNRNAIVYYEVVIDMEAGGQQVINLQNPAGIGAGTPVTVNSGNISIR